MGLASIYFAATGREEEFIMPQAVSADIHTCMHEKGTQCHSMNIIYMVYTLLSQTLVALVYAIFITSAYCYGLITWANKFLPTSVLASFEPVQVYCTLS